MKINKILAAGIAATLAVTSLSAVAGAEVQTKTFDVYRTQATFWNHSIKFSADVNKTIAAKLRQAENGKISITGLDTYVRQTLNYEGFLAYLGQNDETSKRASYLASPSSYNYGCDLYPSAVKITATGYQHVGDTATVTKTFSFTREDGGYNAWYATTSGDKAWNLIVLDDKTPIYHDGEFASYFFNEITSLELEVQLSGRTLLEDEYNYWAWMGTSGDVPNKRFVDIGDIKVIGTKAVPTAYTAGLAETTTNTYTYGKASESSNTDDYNNILAEQAKSSTKSWTKGAVAQGNAADVTVGAGYMIGAKASDGAYPRAATSTQNLYEGTAATADGGFILKAMTADTAVVDDGATSVKIEKVTDVVIGTTGSQVTKNVYSVTDNAGTGVMFFTTNVSLTDTQIGLLQDAILAAGPGLTTAADVNNDDIPAIINATENASGTKFITDATGYDPAAAGIITLVDKDNYDAVELSADTGDKVFDKNTVILKSVSGGKTVYAWNDSEIYGQDFGASTLDDAMSTAHLLAYAFANGGWFASKSTYGDTTDADVTTAYGTYTAYNNTNDNGLVGATNPSTEKTNGWLPKTTNSSKKTVKNRIDRDDVWMLSLTNGSRSSGAAYGDSRVNFEKFDQTYDATFWDGTQPYGFAGLASQVADFFNKQDNGTITFTFAANSGATTGKWTDGVPSTEVGLKGFSSEYLSDFALFFNYNNTTGTMLSAVKSDLTSGTVTFDISDYLKDCGGLTKATLENIYYGLDNGIQKEATSSIYGLWVSKVELAYDDAGAAVDATTDDDATEDDAAVVVADDDDDAEVEDDDVAEDDDIFEDDDVIEDDDDDDDDVDADVIEDDDDDDTDVNNDVDYVDAGADDDANPGTGVGLAVIPAIVAAAAVVVSKKRK